MYSAYVTYISIGQVEIRSQARFKGKNCFQVRNKPWKWPNLTFFQQFSPSFGSSASFATDVLHGGWEYTHLSQIAKQQAGQKGDDLSRTKDLVSQAFVEMIAKLKEIALSSVKAKEVSNEISLGELSLVCRCVYR